MDFMFLGSAAAEGIPAIFCNCPVCNEARKRGGREMRGRTAYAWGESVRIDFGPDSLWQEQRYNLRSENLRHLLVTHSHEDHLDSHLLDYRRPGFSVVPEANILNIYGNPGVGKAIRNTLGRDYDSCRLNFVELEYFKPCSVPEENMVIHPLIADHMPSEKPMIYVIERNGQTILIGNDTGYFPDDDWTYLANKKFHFNLVILDCTMGKNDCRRGHMGAPATVEIFDRIRKENWTAPECRMVVNHFSHNGGWLQDDFESFFAPHEVEVGFDGKIISLADQA